MITSRIIKPVKLRVRTFLTKCGRVAEQIIGVPAKVTSTTPSDGAVNQQLDVTITWSKPSMAQSYDVYFYTETGVPGAAVNEGQLARSYVPSGLALDSTYYFRIDSKNSFGTTTGDEMSFSTWSESDIETDEAGVPLTDERGQYLETFAS